MRKIRFIRVVIPEIVAYLCYGEERFPDYRCSQCGCGVGDNYSYCPYCGSELDWKYTDKLSEAFSKLVEKN